MGRQYLQITSKKDSKMNLGKGMPDPKAMVEEQVGKVKEEIEEKIGEVKGEMQEAVDKAQESLQGIIDEMEKTIGGLKDKLTEAMNEIDEMKGTMEAVQSLVSCLSCCCCCLFSAPKKDVLLENQ